jgi:hypothetical protein
MVFIDLEKAYDKIQRNVMWWALNKHKVATKYDVRNEDMNNDVVTSVQISDGDIDEFPIRIRLCPGLNLSHYLFDLVMDKVTMDILEDVSWCMFFVDDVILVDNIM